MNPIPFTLRGSSLRAFIEQTAPVRFRRPASGMFTTGRYGKIEPGRLFWIREPFHLPANVQHLAPSWCQTKGVEPVFAHDVSRDDLQRLGLGRARAAYTLLREWHRQHAILTAVEDQSLLDITEEEAIAEGFANRDAGSGVGTIRSRNLVRTATPASPSIIRRSRSCPCCAWLSRSTSKTCTRKPPNDFTHD